MGRRSYSVVVTALFTIPLVWACSSGVTRGPVDAGQGGAFAAPSSSARGGGAPYRDASSSTDPPPTLDASAPPSDNFDLSIWELQEPVGQPGAPTNIDPPALFGFHDAYLYTDPSDGAMTFWAPENGVTTANSNYPRSELRELNADGSRANWAISGVNTLSATVAVVKTPDHVCVGQIHLGTALEAGTTTSTKPLLELYVYANGDVRLGVEKSPSGGQTTYPIANIALGTPFRYTITLDGSGTLRLDFNGTTSSYTIAASFMAYGMYFKAGAYNQSTGSDPSVGSLVKFYSLDVKHTR